MFDIENSHDKTYKKKADYKKVQYTSKFVWTVFIRLRIQSLRHSLTEVVSNCPVWVEGGETEKGQGESVGNCLYPNGWLQDCIHMKEFTKLQTSE